MLESMVERVLVVAVVAVACRSSNDAPRALPRGSDTPIAVEAITPNQFLARGTPTIIACTGGDDCADRECASQAALLATVLRDASVIPDTAVEAWPAHAVAIGGPHVNRALASAELPFELSAGRLVIGGQTFTGDYALATVAPIGPQRQNVLVYASTGTPGVENITWGVLVGRGNDPIVIADEFGPLATGAWRATATDIEAALGPRSRRVGWRTIERVVAGISVRFRIFAGSPSTDDEARIAECSRGIERAHERLQLAGHATMTLYLHPDRKSKEVLTGFAGDGHAVPFARTLHVVAQTGIESLVAHEASHILLAQHWGASGSALLGEGVAVWASGTYQGVELDTWARRLPTAWPAAELLGARFRTLPEAEAYPMAGLFVGAAIQTIGLEGVRDHLYGASASTWTDACKRAGTDPRTLDHALARRISE